MNYSGGQFPFSGECWIPVMNVNPGFHQQSGYHYQTSTMSSYQCEYCSKLFVHKEAFDRHVLSHDLEKIVAGSQVAEQTMLCKTEVSAPEPSTQNCGKPQHKVTPVSKVALCRPKLHACDECPKSYTRKDHLSRHKLWHLGDRPHVCTICFKAFIRKDKLIRHEKIHVKDFVCNCNICGKQFLRKESLSKHLKTHDPGHVVGKRKVTTNTSQQTDDVAVMDRMYSSPNTPQTGTSARPVGGAQTL